MTDNGGIPVTEADLHAFADGQLPETRRLQVEVFLASRPEERTRVDAWMRNNRALRALLEPVLAEPIPVALPLAPGERVLLWRQFAVAASIALVSAGAGWLARGMLHASPPPSFAGGSAAQAQSMAGFARRAAVAHVVYSPEVHRPVEVGANQEDQLVAWLSKRLDAPLKPPHLGRVGYELIGGRLLPGEQGPVAQFMYHDSQGRRLTLYVTRETAATGDTGFRFAQDGPVNVFYWVDGGGRFGYAISAGVDRNVLYPVVQEVYRQLAPTEIDSPHTHERKNKP